LFKYQILNLKKQMQHLKTKLKVTSITDQKNPVGKIEKFNMADSRWRLKFEKILKN